MDSPEAVSSWIEGHAMRGFIPPDWFMAVVWMFATASLWRCSLAAAQRLASRARISGTIIDGLTIALSILILSAFGLSGLMLLTGGVWLSAVIAISLGGLFCLCGRSHQT